ncbi:hypothetical protein ACSE35_03960, partial [Staphylococcus aureus]
MQRDVDYMVVDGEVL